MFLEVLGTFFIKRVALNCITESSIPIPNKINYIYLPSIKLREATISYLIHSFSKADGQEKQNKVPGERQRKTAVFVKRQRPGILTIAPKFR